MKPLHWLPGYTKNASLVNQTLNKTGNLNPARQTDKQFKSGYELERFLQVSTTTCLTPLEIHYSKRSLLAPLLVQLLTKNDTLIQFKLKTWLATLKW